MKKVTILLALFTLIIYSCGPSVEGESKSWKRNVEQLKKLKADYPGYVKVIDARIAEAKKVYDAASSIKDEKEKAAKMSQANSMLSTGCVGNLKNMKSKIKEVKSKKKELKALGKTEADIRLIKIVAEDANDAVKKALKVLNAKEDKAKCDYVGEAYDNLDATVKDIKKRISSIKDKIQEQKDSTKKVVKKTDDANKMVKCEYCGTKNKASNAKCKSCGANLK